MRTLILILFFNYVAADPLLSVNQSMQNYITDRCKAFDGHSCDHVLTPTALANSGGGCTAVVMLTGLVRAGILNNVISVVSIGSLEFGTFPLVKASSSGGSFFTLRWSVLEEYKMNNKAVYPCYLLQARFREPCTFHQALGAVADVCDSEYLNVIQAAIDLVFFKAIHTSGGPSAVFGAFTFMYYLFINTLPLSVPEKKSVSMFWSRYTHFSGLHVGQPEIWSVGVDLVSPSESTPNAPYNYGFGSHLARAYNSFVQSSSKWVVSQINASLGTIVIQSGHIQGAMALMPFSLAGNNWDANTFVVSGPQKIMALLVSYVMVKRLVNKKRVYSSTSWPHCERACPVVDLGIIDNGPVMPALAATVKLQGSKRPAMLRVRGPAASFTMYSYLMGVDKLEVWSSTGGANMCPFPDVSYCKTLRELREVVKRVAPPDVLREYLELSSSYAVWLPQNQVISAYCADPLSYDTFKSTCEAASFCSLGVMAIPNQRMDISYTLDPVSVMLSVIFIGATPLSKSFVADFVPARVMSLPNFAHLDVWFPSFSITGSEKGGTGFNKPSAHTFMDYMTFLLLRVAQLDSGVLTQAFKIWTGAGMDCEYTENKLIQGKTVDSVVFQIKQQS